MSWFIGLPMNMRKLHLVKIVGIRQQTIHHNSYRRGWGRDLFQSIYESQCVTLQNKLLDHQVLRKVQTEFNSLASTFTAPRGALIFLLNASIILPVESLTTTPIPADFWCIKTAPSTLTMNWLAWGGLQWACVIRLGPFSTWTLS